LAVIFLPSAATSKTEAALKLLLPVGEFGDERVPGFVIIPPIFSSICIDTHQT
jgi:hypothetical protein